MLPCLLLLSQLNAAVVEKLGRVRRSVWAAVQEVGPDPAVVEVSRRVLEGYSGVGVIGSVPRPRAGCEWETLVRAWRRVPPFIVALGTTKLIIAETPFASFAICLDNGLPNVFSQSGDLCTSDGAEAVISDIGKRFV